MNARAADAPNYESSPPAPPAVVSVDSAPRYAWGSTGEGWRLLDDPGLSVIRERMPSGEREPWHLHRRSRQFFYVLSGHLRIDHAGGATNLRPGEGLHVPPGSAHQVSSISTENVLFLVVSSPSTAGDRSAVEPPSPSALRPPERE